MNDLHPDPILAAHGLGIDFPKRFFSKVEKTDCCWNWLGAINEGRYAKILRNERQGPMIAVQRASFLLHNGNIPDGFELLNVCPNRCFSCVNPNHWTLGKHSDIKRLSTMTHTNVPLTQGQIARAEMLCAQSGITLAAIEALRTANHVTPPWMVEIGFSVSFANRFFAKIHKTDHCWPWLACKNDGGYGYIGIGSGTVNISAHKASFMLHYGPIPEGMDILHNCAPAKDNPSCVCPLHLRAGPAKENLEDATRKYWGEKSHHWNTSKLSNEAVSEILRLSKEGKSRKDLAKQFGISAGYVSHIVHGNRRRINC